jgi:hypothetical protein
VAYRSYRAHIRIARPRPAEGRLPEKDQVNAVDTATLEQRYRRSSRLSKRGRVAWGAAGVLALSGAVGYFGLQQASPTIQATVLGYTVTGDHAVDVRFQVDEASGKGGTCIVRARAESGEEVGRVSVPVPSGPTRQVLATTVKTSERAVNGDVLECDTA